ncbi:MAG: malonate decarboxylase holo-[acyl-carrier-protein] synthase [Herminiimonas sp.]|nr:malonate decarboxylase holo-[acyl-carrier-protein] synthase [Herminiimonas sp.]
MFARHSLAWLSDQGWRALGETAGETDRSAIDLWRAAGWPATVRRRDAAAPADNVCLGLASPPDPLSGIKHRTSLVTPLSSVVTMTMPRTLDTVQPALPAAWATAVRALLSDAEMAGLQLRVYGSCAWQTLTGRCFLGPDSDLDLLIYPVSQQQLDDAIALLARHAVCLPLDGEIIFPSGQAVAWKEWQFVAGQAGARVLVKEIDRVSLQTTTALLATFGTGHA